MMMIQKSSNNSKEYILVQFLVDYQKILGFYATQPSFKDEWSIHEDGGMGDTYTLKMTKIAILCYKTSI